MPGGNHGPAIVPQDRSRALLDWVHERLLSPPGDEGGLADLLAELARAGGATAAGFAGLGTDGRPEVRRHVRADGAAPPTAPRPWDEQPDLLARLAAAPAGLTLTTSEGSTWLLAAAGQPGQGYGLLWLEGLPGHEWGPAEGAALALAGHALLRQAQPDGAPWGRQLEQALRQQRLEDAAVIVRRLAHDFGNVLTSILGFTELSLSQVPHGSALHSYLQEVHRATQQGAELTGQLRLFSRRGSGLRGSTPVDLALQAEIERLRDAWGPAVRLQLLLPSNLPPVGMDTDMLRQALLPLLDNAREAIAGTGTVVVTAGLAELTPAGCCDLVGNPRPGPCVEIAVRDTGCGLPAEARGRLPGEPFFTTKPRHRGVGLAAVYGLLQVHRGGFRLEPAAGGGTVARLYLPVVAVPEPPADPGLPPPATGRGEKVLVVDDDPLILQLVCTTLERAGYQARPAAGGAEAVAAYTDPAAGPFVLVLSDVLMPRMSGVDLARRLLHHDARLNLLFMSGHVSADFARENFGNWNFTLLQKPFQAAGLLRAVRAALDRGPHPSPARGPQPSQGEPCGQPSR